MQNSLFAKTESKSLILNLRLIPHTISSLLCFVSGRDRIQKQLFENGIF